LSISWTVLQHPPLVIVTVRYSLTSRDICRLVSALRRERALDYPVSLDARRAILPAEDLAHGVSAATKMVAHWFADPQSPVPLPCAGFANALPVIRCLRRLFA
jgi:hypothetical protein